MYLYDEKFFVFYALVMNNGNENGGELQVIELNVTYQTMLYFVWYAITS